MLRPPGASSLSRKRAPNTLTSKSTVCRHQVDYSKQIVPLCVLKKNRQKEKYMKCKGLRYRALSFRYEYYYYYYYHDYIFLEVTESIFIIHSAI